MRLRELFTIEGTIVNSTANQTINIQQVSQESGGQFVPIEPIYCAPGTVINLNVTDCDGDLIASANMTTPEVPLAKTVNQQLTAYVNTLAWSLGHGFLRGARPLVQQALIQQGVSENYSQTAATVLYYVAYAFLYCISLVLGEEDSDVSSIGLSLAVQMFIMINLSLLFAAARHYAEKNAEREESMGNAIKAGLWAFGSRHVDKLGHLPGLVTEGFSRTVLGFTIGSTVEEVVEDVGLYLLEPKAKRL
jgi:hypothetical protein